MEQIRYKLGTFLSFTATRSFGLGANNVKIMKGTEVQFDGTVVQYGGDEFPHPQLRSAIKAGWIVLSDDYDEDNPVYNIRQSAGIRMNAPTPGKAGDQAQGKYAAVTVEADERIVMGYQDHAQNTKVNNGFAKAASVTMASGQDGVEIRRSFSTPTKAPRQVAPTGSEAAVESAVERSLKPIQAVQGRTQDDVLETLSEDERDEYLARKRAFATAYVTEEELDKVKKLGATKKVGKVKKKGAQQTEGFTVTESVGNGIEIADAGGTGGKAEITTYEEDGIKFTATNGPKNKPVGEHPSQKAVKSLAERDGTADVRRRVATAICPDFPDNYDFSATPKKKLARLQVDYEDRPDVLRAVFAAETDDFKLQLLEEFPSAFA